MLRLIWILVDLYSANRILIPHIGQRVYQLDKHCIFFMPCKPKSGKKGKKSEVLLINQNFAPAIHEEIPQILV
jgi:hypothetical protein